WPGRCSSVRRRGCGSPSTVRSSGRPEDPCAIVSLAPTSVARGSWERLHH
ncbi:MAG: hypothetical protein AVDCRST_MAG33-1084, partial [uncultured Thermomicrobiales bacterium]